MLIHVREGRGVLFSDMAKTLTYRMTPKAMQAIGIARTAGTYEDWYNRLHKAKERLEDLVDPLPGDRRRVPTFDQYRSILADREERKDELSAKKERLDFLMNSLVESSVNGHDNKDEILEGYEGNVALDATKIRMYGQAGVSVQRLRNVLKDAEAGREVDAQGYDDEEADEEPLVEGPEPVPTAKRKKRKRGLLIRTINYDAGNYTRLGNHDGTGLRKDKVVWALELELAVMTANRPGEEPDFPLLALGVGSHRPGAIKHEAYRIFADLERRGYESGKAICDTAYLPGAIGMELQGPLRLMGRELVFDYGVDDLGKKDYFEDVIQVDGQWYVRWLPRELQEAEHIYRKALKEDREKPPTQRMSDAERAALATFATSASRSESRIGSSSRAPSRGPTALSASSTPTRAVTSRSTS